MSVCILHDERHDNAALCCSTSDFAFGPVFSASREHGKDSEERAEAFLRWINAHPIDNPTSRLFGRFDVRHLKDDEMALAYGTWLGQEEAQYAAEEKAAQLQEEEA